MEEFLPWIKDRVVRLHGRPDVYNLMGSGIREPVELLTRLAQEHRADLQSLLGELNEWGHPALVRHLGQRYGLPADMQFQVTAGATAAFWLACYATLSAGDRVLVEAPTYEPLRVIPADLGAKVDLLPRRPENNYQVDADELASLVTARTRLVILTNLHNPSGAALDDDALRRIARAAQSRNPAAMVLVDETFHDFVLDQQGSCVRLGPEFLAINTLTKVYGLGLLRCGWLVAPAKLLHRVRRAWIAVAGIGSRLTEALAALALEHMSEFEAHWRAVLAANRPILSTHLRPLTDEGLLHGEVVPRGCTCFPRLPGELDTDALAHELEAQGVFVVAGRFFDRPDYLRIGFGGDSGKLDEGLRRLTSVIRSRAKQRGSRAGSRRA
jgi:aspartate/methionine/tyrosine aminotransferase